MDSVPSQGLSSKEFDDMKAQKDHLVERDAAKIRAAILQEFRSYEDLIMLEEETLP